MSRTHRHPSGAFTIIVPELLLDAGQVAVFQGASGCGKSTLFDTVGMISKPDYASEFSVFAGGCAYDVRGAKAGLLSRLRSIHVGYVLQHGGLIPSLSALDNILLPIRLAGRKSDMVWCRKLTERLELGGLLTKKPAHMSGGQLQRVAIARALIHRPRLILADEPTGQLDSITGGEVRDLLVSAARGEGACLMVVTHDESLFSSTADRFFSFNLERNAGGIVSTLANVTR